MLLSPALQPTTDQTDKQLGKYNTYPDFDVVGLLGIGKSGDRKFNSAELRATARQQSLVTLKPKLCPPLH